MGGVVVRRMAVPVGGLPAGADGLRIAHISDLHLRKWNRVLERAQRLLLELEYDLLVFTGDFTDGPDLWRKASPIARQFFGPIHPPLGTYAVLGNHDSPMIVDSLDGRVSFLRNDFIPIERNSTAFFLAGVEQTERQLADLDAALPDEAASRAILLAHYPSTVFEAPADRVGLVLSGHTHGGQIRLPGLGCLWTNDLLPNRLGHGLHDVGGIQLHVTAGLGTSNPIPFRFRCPAEIAILTLHAVIAEDAAPCAKPCATGSRSCNAETGVAATSHATMGSDQM